MKGGGKEMMKVKVGKGYRKVFRQWEKDMMLVALVGVLGGLWISGYLGAWIR